MILAHKIELRPTWEQDLLFCKYTDTMRFAYNQLVAKAGYRKELQNLSTPQIMGSRKTYTLGLCKTEARSEAGLFEGVNTNLNREANENSLCEYKLAV
jgi:hypothetical protein